MTVPYLVRVIFPGKSGFPRDRFTNDFCLNMATAIPNQAGADVLADTIFDEFYGFIVGGNNLIETHYSNQIDRGTDKMQVTFTDLTGHLDGTGLGSPDFVSTHDLPAASGSPAPEEVAAVLSFKADTAGLLEVSGATRPKSRRRGRLYLGPLNTGTFATAGAGVFLALAFQGTILGAAENFLAQVPEWSVWSRADAAVHPVVDGWLDNAFDTQRRRGVRANGRTTWPA